MNIAHLELKPKCSNSCKTFLLKGQFCLLSNAMELDGTQLMVLKVPKTYNKLFSGLHFSM